MGDQTNEGDAEEPIRLEVESIRNGRSFLTGRVVARQSVGAILNLSSSSHVPEDAPEVQTEAPPAVPPPETPPLDSVVGRRGRGEERSRR